MGVADSMKSKYGDKLDVRMYTVDSPEASEYVSQFKSSTNVMLDNEWIPIDTATDKDKMDELLSRHI